MSEREKRQQQQNSMNKISNSPMTKKKYPRSLRVIDSIAAPPTNRLTLKDIFGSSGEKTKQNVRSIDFFFLDKPNLTVLLKHLEAEGRVELDAALTIMIRGREITSREPNMVEIATPITIVGDLHGQFYDMVRRHRIFRFEIDRCLSFQMKMFEKGGDVASNR